MPIKKRPAGYLWLQKQYQLQCIPHAIKSYVVESGTRRTTVAGEITEEVYPKNYWPGENDFEHLEFAMRYEGLHLQLLRALLPQLKSHDVTTYIAEKPTSHYARRLWFLYEQLTGQKLDLPDASQGNYVDLLDPQRYYTGLLERSPRHRVNMNLIGTTNFSPMIRRTRNLENWEAKKLDQQCKQLLRDVSHEVYERTLHFLYTRETKSSYAIERETPDQKRTQRFVSVLRNAVQQDYLNKDSLVDLQRSIVDKRFANSGYRDTIAEQNYVGTSLAPGEEYVHFIPPKPTDLAELMGAFLDASRRIILAPINPVVAAASIAYPFVFLHPFSDGNGRLHRFLIHYVLGHLQFATDGLIFPVSASMLRNSREYEASLEAFSRPLMQLVDFELEPNGHLTVNNDTRDLYRYIDCTPSAEALFGFVADTIEREVPTEIQFLKHYDDARQRMRRIVDLPNRHADLFIRLCVQNSGTLSKTKRNIEEFALLSATEIEQLEIAVREAFALEIRSSS